MSDSTPNAPAPSVVTPRVAPRLHLAGMLAGLFLACGLVLAAMLVTRAWVRIADAASITVTGSARRNVVSDFIVWRATFTVTAPTLIEAQRRLREDRDRISAFIIAAGVTNAQFAPVVITEVTGQDRQRNGQDETTSQRIVAYKLSQPVEIRADQVDKIMQLDRDSVALLEKGVQLTPSVPEFIYTRAADAKVEMLGEATQDARSRAEQISSKGGRRLGGLRSAKMGVFQIAPIYSNETTWEGRNDTSSRDKTITAVVSATFLMR